MADLGAMGIGDVNQYKPMEEFDLLPEMKAVAVIVASEIIDTTKAGKMLVLEYEILEPAKYKGRKIRSRHNLVNTGPKAKEALEIAKREIASIGQAVGVPAVNDSQVLHNLPHVIKIRLERQTEKDPATGTKRPRFSASGGPLYQNEIVTWEKAGTPLTEPLPMPDFSKEARGPVQTGGGAPATPGAPAGAATPPWMRSA